MSSKNGRGSKIPHGGPLTIKAKYRRHSTVGEYLYVLFELIFKHPSFSLDAPFKMGFFEQINVTPFHQYIGMYHKVIESDREVADVISAPLNTADQNAQAL